MSSTRQFIVTKAFNGGKLAFGCSMQPQTTIDFEIVEIDATADK
jgi:hypothetical protein